MILTLITSEAWVKLDIVMLKDNSFEDRMLKLDIEQIDWIIGPVTTSEAKKVTETAAIVVF